MVKICIGVATRRRPQMFARTLDSLARLNRPDGTSLHFIVIENDEALHIGDIAADFEKTLTRGETLHTDFEPRLGIPIVRNRILDAAIEEGGDYLACIDDDEVADVNWLLELHSQAQGRGLDMVGGVVRMERPQATALTVCQNLVYRDLCTRQEKATIQSANRYATGDDGDVKVFTSNMLCRLDFIHRNQIRFDEALRYSHGEDYDFYLQVKNAGGVTGHAPRALVYEMVHMNRLSLAFQFRLSRNAARASYSIRYARNKQRAKRELVRSSFFVLWKVILGCFRLLLSCFNRGQSFIRGLKGIATAIGRTEGMLGMQDIHYKNTDGH